MNDMDILQAAQNQVQAGTQAGASGFLGMSFGAMAAALVFSSIGLIYFRYGKSTGNTATVLAGIALLAFPYFVQSTWYIVGIGLGIMALHKALSGRF